MRQRDSCQSVQAPRYHFSGRPSFCTGGGPCCSSHSFFRKEWKGAVKTAATSLGSSRGIIFSSTLAASDGDVDEVDWEPEGQRYATQGRTPSSVFARLAGSSQRCSTLKPLGNRASDIGSPISSQASRRAVSKGLSVRVSDFPIFYQLVDCIQGPNLKESKS